MKLTVNATFQEHFKLQGVELKAWGLEHGALSQEGCIFGESFNEGGCLVLLPPASCLLILSRLRPTELQRTLSERHLEKKILYSQFAASERYVSL